MCVYVCRYIPKSLYAKKPLNAALATLHEQGYVVGGCDAQDASAHKDLCTYVLTPSRSLSPLSLPRNQGFRV